MGINLWEWGDPGTRALVCLHGLTGHGARFRKLAEERLPSWHVLAPDLRGHGGSNYEPPWSVEQHLADVLGTTGAERAVWLGHSFGGRLVMELTARRPDIVEKAILLDPAIQMMPHVAFDLAEEERKELSFASHEEAIRARLDSGRLFHTPLEMLGEEMTEHLEQGPDGRFRYRYCKSGAIAAYSVMAADPPAFESLRVPTLLVVAKRSWLLLDEQVAGYRAALGDLLEVIEVPGGHTVLWDAFNETATVVESFLG